MRIRRLILRCFRNYEQAETDLSDKVNLFVGRNAQGKTNFLEAIYTLSAGRSFRGMRDIELIRTGADYFHIVGSIVRRVSDTCLELKYSADGSKIARANIHEKIRPSELSKYLNVVLFSPEDLNLVKGAPSDRRRFLDMEISQLSPSYRHWTNSYAKVLSQRNAVLKDLQRNAGHDLEPWDDQLADLGARIMVRRHQVIGSLAVLSRITYRKVSGTGEMLTIRYAPSVVSDDGQGYDEMRRAIQKRQQELRKVEIGRGVTLVGPHRDDIAFEIDGMDAFSYGSQGQQRTAALSVKLAVAEHLSSQVGDEPVVLLDDVLSELDEVRRHNLVSEVVERYQTIITSADPETRRLLPPDSSVFRVHAGSLCRE